MRKWRENGETLRQLRDILKATLRQLGHNFETQTTFFYHLGKLKVIMSLNGNYPDRGASVLRTQGLLTTDRVV